MTDIFIKDIKTNYPLVNDSLLKILKIEVQKILNIVLKDYKFFDPSYIYNDIWNFHVFTFLNFNDFKNIRLVNNYFRNLINDNIKIKITEAHFLWSIKNFYQDHKWEIPLLHCTTKHITLQSISECNLPVEISIKNNLDEIPNNVISIIFENRINNIIIDSFPNHIQQLTLHPINIKNYPLSQIVRKHEYLKIKIIHSIGKIDILQWYILKGNLEMVKFLIEKRKFKIQVDEQLYETLIRCKKESVIEYILGIINYTLNINLLIRGSIEQMNHHIIKTIFRIYHYLIIPKFLNDYICLIKSYLLTHQNLYQPPKLIKVYCQELNLMLNIIETFKKFNIYYLING